MALVPLTPENRVNFRHLYADVFWFGVLAGSTLAFLAVYAARLGATGFQISLLTAGPAVVNLLLSLPAGRWLEHRPLVRTTYRAALLHRLGYLALALLPPLVSPELEVWVVVGAIALMSVPGTLLAIGFNALYADAVPPDWRGEVVGKRNALMAVSLTTTALLSGQLLDRIVFPLNYQIVFLIGALGALLSTYHVGQVRTASHPPPARAGHPVHDQARPGMWRFRDSIPRDAIPRGLGLRFLTRPSGRPLLRLELLRTSFGPFMAAYLLFYACQYLPLPVVPLFFVNELNLTDGAISLGSGLFHMVMLLVSLRASHLSARYGHYRLLVLGALSFGLYPLLVGLAQDATLFWIASLAGGGIWAVTNAGLVNRLMERVPEENRPAYMALHNLALNLGILAGSLSGPYLAGVIGLREAVLVAAGLRFAAGIVLMIWG